MNNRRDFIKQALLLSGGVGFSASLPASIRKAWAINPAPGSTYLDAEHVVILMQENRSFDHCFGSLKGVRGFNDPRAIFQPDGNLVWMQTNEHGETYAPFRFNIKDTKATWMGSTPHSRGDQVDAWNKGRYNQWLKAKRVRNKDYADMPLTLGYYTREDIPFHYALADAFTVCDHNFSSVMSSTDPNRLYFWTGNIRDKYQRDGRVIARNPTSQAENFKIGGLNWKTFPEVLQENRVSWKMYQNDIQAGGGFKGEERSWLGNFGCNPLEWFEAYNVKFGDRYMTGLENQLRDLPVEIQRLERKMKTAAGEELLKLEKEISAKRSVLENAEEESKQWNRKNFKALSARDRELFDRAFTINRDDPDFHKMMTFDYEENGESRSMQIPKGDLFYQFRKDVQTNNLPTISWLVAPWNLIDHPSTAWYGALYVSEVLEILTQNPEIWKKTIFILTYDENDGYFDHIAPFVAPNPTDPHSGKCSEGLSSKLDYITREEEEKQSIKPSMIRDAPIGLGYRIPMIIPSPSSRGGYVNSEIFDHTSTIQFLETFLNKKYNKNIHSENITDWRRAICGDLTSAFRPYINEEDKLPFLEKNSFLEGINNARYKDVPTGFKTLSEEEIHQANTNPLASFVLPKQEAGIKPANAIHYELYCKGQIDTSRTNFVVEMEAGNAFFGKKALGAAFNLRYTNQDIPVRSYTLEAGRRLVDTIPLSHFPNRSYQVQIHGVNGFYREFAGDKNDPMIDVELKYHQNKGGIKSPSGKVVLSCGNTSLSESYEIEVVDNAYRNPPFSRLIPAGKTMELVLNVEKYHHWYDFSLRIKGKQNNYLRSFAGHVETGTDSYTDPYMGRIV